MVGTTILVQGRPAQTLSALHSHIAYACESIIIIIIIINTDLVAAPSGPGSRANTAVRSLLSDAEHSGWGMM